MKRIGINGYGRIGRALLRAYFARFAELKDILQIIKINELANSADIAYLTRYDSLYGKFSHKVDFVDNLLHIDEQKIILQNNKEIEKLDWSGVDILVESSGSFKDKSSANLHLRQGAKKLLFANPATADVDKTIIYGVNHTDLTPNDKIISAGSCTTNCLIPILKILKDSYKIKSVSATTLHAAMVEQNFLDAFNNKSEQIKMRAGQNILPIQTQLAKGVVRIMPELADKIIAQHIRVPSLGVSGMEINLTLQENSISAQAIQDLFSKKALGVYGQILGVNSENLVSGDFLQNDKSAIIDLQSIKVVQNQLRIFAWFDSEWGFANRLLDILKLEAL